MKVSMTDEELKVAQEVLATRETTVATRELKAHAAEVASQRAALEFGQKLHVANRALAVQPCIGIGGGLVGIECHVGRSRYAE